MSGGPASGVSSGSLILVALITLAFAIGTGHHFSTYGLAPTAVLLSAVTIAALRSSYELVTGEVLRQLGVRRYALLAGSGENLAHLHGALGSGRNGIDYEFVGAVAPSADGVGLPVLGDVRDLPAVLDRERVDELIVTDSDFGERELLEIVDHAHRRGIEVRIAPKATELLTQRVEFVPGQGIPLFELRPPAFVGMDWVVKRVFDLVVSGLVLVVGLPLWLGIAAAVKLSSRGPVLYRDRRVGLGEQDFGMLKFRTMHADAAGQQAELEASNEADGPLFKIREDPRVTAVGAVLRRLSLDEIPQLWNVLRGEMSLVGPRPLPLRDYERLEALAPQALPRAPGRDRSLADLGPLEPRLRRPRPARLLLPRELVDLARHLDPGEDHPGGHHRPRRLLRWSASSSPGPAGSSAGTCGPSSARRSCRSTATCSTPTRYVRPSATRSRRGRPPRRASPRSPRPGRTRCARGG